MAITSADIQNQSFSIDRKGYDVDEVDVFLERVANEVDELNAAIEQLEAELDGDKFAGLDTPVRERGGSSEDMRKKDALIADLQSELEEKKANDNAIAQALIIAQRSADELILNANSDADQIRQDAEDEAQRIIDKANAEKQRILEEIEKLEDDREDIRTEYQGILKDFISDATKKLTSIGGTSAVPASAHAKPAAKTVSKNQVPIRATSGSAPAVAPSYVAPQPGMGASIAPTTPKPSRVEKDLSGFGDAADGFDFVEID
ncbi:MAG: DivIVA domain-containing protein [Coriobacteriaceae bacterium]|jgi:DivIVA domain-containing protein|nr:DivIVA domain-containing protein [Coriobacteriaceae bacterium]